MDGCTQEICSCIEWPSCVIKKYWNTFVPLPHTTILLSVFISIFFVCVSSLLFCIFSYISNGISWSSPQLFLKSNVRQIIPMFSNTATLCIEKLFDATFVFWFPQQKIEMAFLAVSISLEDTGLFLNDVGYFFSALFTLK